MLMSHYKYFTFEYYEEMFKIAKEEGYKIITCLDYIFNHDLYENEKILINRIDIDLSCKHAQIVAEIFDRLNIIGSFFFRLHADEYNLLSFEN